MENKDEENQDLDSSDSSISSDSLNPRQIYQKNYQKNYQKEYQKNYQKSNDQIENNKLKNQVNNMSLNRANKKRSSDRVNNMNPERANKKRSNNRVDNMDQEQIYFQRERHRIANFDEQEIYYQRERHRIANLDKQEIYYQRERHRISNLDKQEIYYQRERHRISNLDERQQEEQRERHRTINLSLDSIARRQQAEELRRDNFQEMGQEWDYENRCQHCEALWLKSDSKTSRESCCKNGIWRIYGNGENQVTERGFPALKPLPENLKRIAIEKCQFFSKPSSFYNNLFSYGVTGVDNGRPGIGFEPMNMDACVKLNGRTYHMYQNTSMTNCALSNVIYDGFGDHVQSLIDKGVSLRDATDIRNELNINNGYQISLTDMSNALRNVDFPLLGSSLSIRSHEEEISILRDQNAERGFETFYFTTNNEQVRYINNDSYEVEPLMYPLLHPCGERGWGNELIRCTPPIYIMDYLKSRLLQPEPDLLSLNWRREIELKVNRYQLMARLGQYWILESFSRALDNQIKFQRSNQSYISGGSYQPDRSINTSQPTYLNDTIHGSPKHRKRKAAEALELVAELGKAHCFTTMTVNPFCEEIQSQLLPGQTAFQRPDIVCRVFHQKKQALIHNLKAGRYFDSKCVYLIHVIEFQHRGLPHVHIVYRLENGPDHSDKQACIQFIDKYISAKMPIITNESSDEDLRYEQIVKDMMIHECHDQVNGCLKDGICKRKYSNQTILNTDITEEGYPVYSRPNPQDCFVVPHVKQMLLDDPDGMHCNTEFCGSTYCIIYLYKYLFKGNRKLELTLNNLNDVDPQDEILKYLRGRMITSMEATWRILG